MKLLHAWAVCCASLLLSACMFASEHPLFTASRAATPFANGARFIWREDGTDQTVTYRRRGRQYDIVNEEKPDDAPVRVLFVSVPQTPERDYIAQVEMPSSQDVRVYAFLLPHGDGYRVITAPRVLEEHPQADAALAAQCQARPNAECHFTSAAELIGFYRDVIYPIFVTGGATPNDYLDQLPIGAVVSPRPGKA